MLIMIPSFIYIFFIFIGTWISISSVSMFGMWLGLEFNLMAFLPMIINLENNKKSSEAAIKYFLIQAIASLMVLMSFLIYFFLSNFFIFSLPNLILTISLSMKLGMAPFYLWFPEVMEGLNWINALILLTWQKISPLVILSLFFNFKLLIFLSLLSALVGAIMGLNQTSLRKIMTFSSIAHLGWMTSIISFDSNLWLLYFMVYSFTSFIMVLAFIMFNINYFSQIAMMKSTKKKMIIFINMLSLGGIPPLLGFFPKLMAFSILKSSIPILMLLITSSLITLYFYMRICFSTFTLYNQTKLWNYKEIHKKKITSLSILSFMTLVGMIPMSVWFF
uniref:NADH-ubiquinone oxidoreductase chain 2 n=1 Tax=Altiverruca navicula TaxID=2099647 RepID=A0A343UTE3_9CRUS|nr:NADH dehydrogenase subunit 2 [Altiverruca navicula]AVI15451.1 NADH dehydrogenase subunit 2 [Altiverruca navicula]